MLPKIVIDTLIKIENSGFEARLVGGFVRNFQQNMVVFDIDIATTANPNEIIKIFSDKKLNLKGIEHGTVCFYESQYSLEITTLRQDISCDGRYADVEFGQNFEIDASRRDFTINALYMDKFGKIYDYYHGLEDLKNKKVRFIGDPNLRIQEDYLRILRYFRFNSYLQSKMTNKEYKSDIIKNLDGLKKLSHERMRIELEKIAQQENGLLYFKKMQEYQVFDILSGLTAVIDDMELDNFNFKLDSVSQEDRYVLLLMYFVKNTNAILENFNLKRKEKKFIYWLDINRDLLTVHEKRYEDVYFYVKYPLWTEHALILNNNISKDEMDDLISFYKSVSLPDVSFIVNSVKNKLKNLNNLESKIYMIAAKNKFKIKDEKIISELLKDKDLI